MEFYWDSENFLKIALDNFFYIINDKKSISIIIKTLTSIRILFNI